MAPSFKRLRLRRSHTYLQYPGVDSGRFHGKRSDVRQLLNSFRKKRQFPGLSIENTYQDDLKTHA